MKAALLLALFLLLSATMVQAQSVKLYYESRNGGFVIYADNPALYPTSVILNLEVLNLSFSEGGKQIFVIPPVSERVKIGVLKAMDLRKHYTFNYKYVSTMGDVTITNYDKLYQYDLPFCKGGAFRLNQGYNGQFSHRDENALDFTMPEGTEIVAARDGIVVQVETGNTEACPREECSKFNNYIVIMHVDGTFAKYLHIRHDGSTRRVGSPVKRGDVIAYSGNVGWSSAPHLHFVCILPAFGKSNSLETQFRIDTGNSAVLLQPGNLYSRAY